jgi:hypothetical protein
MCIRSFQTDSIVKELWGSSLSSRPSHLELCFSAQYYTTKNRPVKFFEVDSSKFFMGGIGESTQRHKVAQDMA